MPRVTRFPLLFLGLAVLLAAGCRAGPKGEPQAGDADAALRLTKPEVRSLVSSLSDRIREDVTSAATQIQLKTNDPEINRRTLIWKLRVARAVRRMGQNDDPRVTLLSLWILTRSQKMLFESAEGKGFFGDFQQIAVNAARNLEATVEATVKQILSPANFAQANEDVKKFATAHPFSGDTSDWSSLDLTREMGTNGMFANVVAIPLSPFRAIGGVDRTAAAVSQVADVADRFTTMVSFLPEEIRWNAELLMYEFETSQTTAQLTQDMNTFAASADSIGDSISKIVPLVEELPDRLQADLTKTLDEIDSRQADLQKTIADVQAVVDTVNTEATTANVAEAGKTWDGALGTFNKTLDILMPPPDPNAPPPPPPATDAKAAADESPPFNVNDYTAALEQLTKAAAELNTLLSGVETAAGSDTLFGRVDQSVERTSVELGSIVKRMTWRLTAIVLLAFGLAVVYRFVVVRLIGATAGVSR